MDCLTPIVTVLQHFVIDCAGEKFVYILNTPGANLLVRAELLRRGVSRRGKIFADTGVCYSRKENLFGGTHGLTVRDDYDANTRS